jgi:8-oxo-dGTP pyrophosphatase MutT (NUDIX family)
MDTWITQIKQQLDNEPLPARAAHQEMMHDTRRSWLEENPMPDNAKLSAVMILLCKNGEGAWKIPVIRRVTHHKDKHSGQMGLPGGSIEAADEGDLQRTAVREVSEELGLTTENIKVLGRLTDLYIPVSNFFVQPFVGYFEGNPDFQPQAAEVYELYHIAPEEILDRSNRKIKNLNLSSGFTLNNVPYFDIQNTTIWGATALIFSEFAAVLEKIKP